MNAGSSSVTSRPANSASAKPSNRPSGGRLLPEGLHPYPRWDGPLSKGSALWLVAGSEIRRAFRNPWSQLALLGTLAFAVVYIGDASDQPEDFHSLESFITFLNNMRWGALAVAATVAGPSLLEDSRRGALELYYSRAVSRGDYLGGKIVGVFGLSTVALLLPGLAYYAASFAFFDEQPSGWQGVPFGLVGYSVAWGALVSGLGLGFSSVAKSSRGAVLLLLGGFSVAEVFVHRLLFPITDIPGMELLSPFRVVEQLTDWFFDRPAPYGFNTGLAFAVWAILVALGWSLVAWKRPRVRGEEAGTSAPTS